MELRTDLEFSKNVYSSTKSHGLLTLGDKIRGWNRINFILVILYIFIREIILSFFVQQSFLLNESRYFIFYIA